MDLIKVLLDCGVNIYCCSEQFLKDLHLKFEKIVDRALSCRNFNIHHYFPNDYIKRNVVAIKGTNTAGTKN